MFNFLFRRKKRKANGTDPEISEELKRAQARKKKTDEEHDCEMEKMSTSTECLGMATVNFAGLSKDKLQGIIDKESERDSGILPIAT